MRERDVMQGGEERRGREGFSEKKKGKMRVLTRRDEASEGKSGLKQNNCVQCVQRRCRDLGGGVREGERGRTPEQGFF